MVKKRDFFCRSHDFIEEEEWEEIGLHLRLAFFFSKYYYHRASKITFLSFSFNPASVVLDTTMSALEKNQCYYNCPKKRQIVIQEEVQVEKPDLITIRRPKKW